LVILRRMMLATALTALTASLTFAAPAAIIYVPSPIFMDHMVLQREKAVPVWGVGSPVGGQVTVTFAGQVKTTSINPDGHWRVYLDPMPAGGPFRLEVRGAKTIAFSDVLVGEVWVCSGQSNMARGGGPLGERNDNPYIRTYRHTDWQDKPSEMAWWLGRYLYDALGVPIGLINRAVPGSNIRTWLPDGRVPRAAPRHDGAARARSSARTTGSSSSRSSPSPSAACSGGRARATRSTTAPTSTVTSSRRSSSRGGAASSGPT
jgi:sialate O-acetylesterase